MAVTVSSVTTAGGLLAARVAADHPTRRAAMAGTLLRRAGAVAIMLLGVAMMLH
jgi:hypothetical protein